MESSKKKTQREKVLDYMQEHGGITNREAMIDLGIGRLPSRICELRKMGYPIEAKTVCVKNRDGEPCYPVRYSLRVDANG